MKSSRSLQLVFVLALAAVVVCSVADGARPKKTTTSPPPSAPKAPQFGQCLEEVKAGVFTIDCVKLVISKLLGYAIITGSLILKVPQIVKILGAKDVTGLSPLSFYLDVLTFSSTTAYNYLQGNPFSTYGEAVFILVQNIILVLLLWTYSSTPSSSKLGLTAAFCALTFGMLNTPPEHRWLLSSISIAMAIGRSLPQIFSNFQQGHTGQLAIITLVLNFAGSLARIFTTMQETQDQILLIGYIIGAGLNGTLVLQVLVYWSATNKVTQKKKKE